LKTKLTCAARGESPSSRIDSELDSLLRDNVRITNELQGYLDPNSGNNDICTQLTLLSALRTSEDVPASASRATSVGHSKSGRERPNKRKLTDSIDDRDSIAADSPGGPSPKVVINQKDRLVAKASSSRAGSVPAMREASAKPEDDKDDSGKGKKKSASF
jgi:SAGA-associated factor 29